MSASPQDGRARRPGRSSLSLWKKALFGLLTVVVFFACLEGVLAILGVRPVVDTRDPFVGFAPLPLFVETAGPDDQPLMTTAPNKLPHFNRQTFPRKKPAGTFRIVCLGGSTTYGHPYDDAASFAAWLRELLPLALPETRWEVINAGGISYASYRVAALMEELGQYEPDLFIVYSGHNEFLEERTYRDLRHASPVRLQLTAALAHTRTYALMEKLLRPPPVPAEQISSEVDAILDHSVGPTSYERDDGLRESVLRHYEFNLGRMIAIARQTGAALVLVTPAANLRDCSPFKSQHRDDLSAEQRQQFAGHFQRGQRLEGEGDVAGAVAEYEAAVRIDDRHAEAQYRLGRQLLALDRRAEAAACLRRALDEDVCPIRALSEIPEIVRRVGREAGVPVVDFVALLQNESLRRHGHNVPGNSFFMDHVHLTTDATRMLALAIVRELAKSRIIDPDAVWTNEQAAEATARIESRIDTAAQALALRNLAKVLNWAGKHEEAGPLALQAVALQPDDPECLVLGAAYLKSTGKTDQAIEYYRRALKHAPAYVEAHRLLGAAHVERRQFEEALPHFQRLTELTPDDAHAWHMSGAVLAEMQRYEEALKFYEAALKRSPDDPHLHYNLGLALARLDRRDEASRHLRRALELNPDDTDAQRELSALRDMTTP